ncbi:LacI family DNA-binding transcriptional regulator [Rathayibacter toxicus]|uniref:LacI family transcriptional regulator n=1 Tax=Rathayibacter toxicus TaxID=145458 RepID=A0A0C5BTZ9_9MICO|nr:LacI family DNA-binding transcriptional regulator [Rathayibacter toxicus]AJM78127.1 LacI family transcriptional regulator [Rathayibacter toxicus]ALS57617.1 LacI family transcriptional regulator [Rathayibacter toxicus]KKM44970.1 LacI family transcriptional regulator [Rathayibacter toxicus]PPG20712.1 LacI family transcriptional regulator [Rathayibacter toxicus]PPG45816.1 LacI family transcriptional regulator [Rathayibacter toxicus]
MAGIEEVAALAGVSKATVSRALSGRGYVSAETKQRVEHAATSLGYVVSANASSLVTGRSNSIAVIISVINQWFFAGIIEGIQRALLPAGYDLLLYTIDKNLDARRSIFEYYLVRKRVDAIVAVTLKISPAETEALLALGKPIVGIGGELPGIPTLSIDDVAASRLAAEHLLSLGHKRIAHVCGLTEEEMDFQVHTKRREGFFDALSSAGLHVSACDIVPTRFDIPGGHRAGRQVLGDPRTRPTAIVAASDEIAIGIILAARELGLSVPEDVSIIGIDDHPLSELFGLSSIRQNPQQQGELAIELIRGALAELARGEPTRPAQHTTIPASLIIRMSTSVPRSARVGV